jgi:hypothetical protein
MKPGIVLFSVAFITFLVGCEEKYPTDAKHPQTASSQREVRKPENLTMTLARIADSKSEENAYVFVINGVIAYRTVEGLKEYVKGLPKGATLTWSPGCCRIGGEPLLSSRNELRDFKAFCESCGIGFVLVPSG